MHLLDVIFWIFFASVAAFIGWTFIRLFTETLWDRRSARKVKRPVGRGNAGSLNATTGGIQSGGDVAAPMSGSDHSSSITQGDLGSGDSNGGDSGGDFSGGGGESGGGGSSGGW